LQRTYHQRSDDGCERQAFHGAELYSNWQSIRRASDEGELVGALRQVTLNGSVSGDP